MRSMNMRTFSSNFNWTYASLVYSASEYGTKGYEKLTANAPDYGVCFASTVRIDHDQFNASGYDRVVRELMKPTMARIVVVFTDKVVSRFRLSLSLSLSLSLGTNTAAADWIKSRTANQSGLLLPSLSFFFGGGGHLAPKMGPHIFNPRPVEAKKSEIFAPLFLFVSFSFNARRSCRTVIDSALMP